MCSPDMASTWASPLARNAWTVSGLRPRRSATVNALANPPVSPGRTDRMRAEIAALRHRIVLKEFEPVLPPPHDRPARVTVTLADGRQIARECLSAKGGPDRPYATADLFARLETWLAPTYPRLARRLHDLTALRPADLGRGWDTLLPDMLAD